MYEVLRITLLLLCLNIFMIRTGLTVLTMHFKCRGGMYPRSSLERFSVPDDKVGWTVNFPDYMPPCFTSQSLKGQAWADSDIGEPNFDPKWNSIDGNVNRESYMGQYTIENNVPLNPIGRTGICGRGVLGRWGPNHAADPVVTRWKRLKTGEIETDTANKPILQFVAIKRRDTGEWALPGGMVDPGEKVNAAAVREFQEEAVNSLTMSQDEKDSWRLRFERFFREGDEVYRGYVDDRRNTDNSWMETIAYNFHDDSGSVVGSLKLHAGDDAVGVRWVDITPNLMLYASHEDIVKKVLRKCLDARTKQEENKTRPPDS